MNPHLQQILHDITVRITKLEEAQQPQRPWVGLTHGEVVDIYEAVMKEDVTELVDNFARALETKLKEKNG